jgi:fluoroacetyl-CoA thioesterase
MHVNDIADAALVVGAHDSAKALSIGEDDDFPNVFATSRMVALMEIAVL